MLMEIPQQQKDPIDLRGNFKPKGRRSAPKSERQTGKKDKYAYTFKDPNLGKLEVLNTANGWWLDSVKLQKLIDSYKFYATDDQACFYAGISIDQLQYFQVLHPDFYKIKHGCKQYPNLGAKKKIVGEIESNLDNAWKWLERTEKETFSPRVESTGANGRDLYDGLAKEVRDMGEELRNNNNNGKEHISGDDTRDPNAEQGGNGHEATPTENATTGQEVSA